MRGIDARENNDRDGAEADCFVHLVSAWLSETPSASFATVFAEAGTTA
jgi:hypothetical protein